MRVRGREALRSRAPLHSREPPVCLAQSARPQRGTDGQSELRTVVGLTARLELLPRANQRGKLHTSPVLGPGSGDRSGELPASHVLASRHPAQGPWARATRTILLFSRLHMGEFTHELGWGALGLTSSRTCPPSRGEPAHPTHGGQASASGVPTGSPRQSPPEAFMPPLAPWHQPQSPFPGRRCTPWGPLCLGTDVRRNTRLHLQPGATLPGPARPGTAARHRGVPGGAHVPLHFNPDGNNPRPSLQVWRGTVPGTLGSVPSPGCGRRRGCFWQAALRCGVTPPPTLLFLNILHCFIKANIKYLLLGLASGLILHNCSTVYFI